MPSAEVTRSDSNRSDGSQKPRVSFNRDVHVKRIVPRENSRVSGKLNGLDGEAIITSPIRKERSKKSKKELAAEAARVLRQADKVACIADDKGGTPHKYYTLPSRKGNKETSKEYPSNSLDRRPKNRHGSLEHIAPKKPPRTFAAPTNLSRSTRPSIFDVFKKSEKKTEPKKSNLRRSASDASALRPKTFNAVDSSNTKSRKRSGSESEEITKTTPTKKQLTPIIEATPREDYFATSDKENINSNIQEASATTKDKRSESVTDQLKDYIEEVDAELYKETGIRITTPLAKKEPTPIIIDLDKAENISSNKRNKLHFGLGKKLKALTQKKSKTNESEGQERNNVLLSTTPKSDFDKKGFKIGKEETLSPVLTSNIKTAIQELEKSTNRPSNMIHSSQKPADKPPLTKGNTVNTMVKRLSTDSCSSPPPTRTNVLIMPNMSVQHNNNQPFSYTRGLSPDKYRSNEDLPRDLPNSTKPVIYAQVVCGANGLSNGKQTVHTTYNGRRPAQSDSDEGLGGEDSLGFHRKFDQGKSFTHFGDDRLQSFLSDTDKLLHEIDKYKAESPILPKYRSPTHLNGFTSYNGIMERGRGDGMDAKRRESLTEPDMEFGHSPGNHFSLNRTDLSARRDILESRLNRRIIDKQTPSPEHPSNQGSRNNVYISEKSSKYYRNGSVSPVGYKEKYVSETKTDQFGERHTESRTKKILGAPNDRLNSPGFRYNGFDSEPKSLDSQISDYRSSPENHRFESSQHTTNSRSRYRTENPKLVKNKDVHKSTPEIHHSSYPDSRGQHNSYHDSLPRGDKFQSTTSSSQRTRSERHLNREECDRRAEKFDSGIENDFRRDSSERYKPTRPLRTRRDLYNESEDEGFASSLLITSEKQHTENNVARKSRNDYDSDRNTTTREDDFYRHNDSKFIPRERSIDDGSHFDPRLDKEVDRSTLKRIEKKPPKPEKKSGLEKVKSLFMRDTKKKKEKVNTLQKVKSKTTYSRQDDKDESDSKITGLSQDYRYRRRLSTPSPTRDLPKSSKSESNHGSWFKSLDRIGKRKSDKRNKEDTLTSTEEEPVTNRSKLSTSTSNLRFFGDTDQESNGDSVRGIKHKKKSGLKSQSTRDLHNISEELHNSTNAGRKLEAHHKSLTNISESNRELKGSKANLKPPVSPNPRYRQDLGPREDRRRRKRHEISSVESSTEGDSSQQSQRSIVYLHAATVGDIPGPGYLRTGRRSASREDLTSNGSSFIQPQVKTLSRSFSVLAPWKPRHPRDALDIDYTQYPKPTKNGKYEQKQSRNTSNRNDSSTLKKKAQDSKKNNYQQSSNRKSRSKENLSHQSKEEMSRGSTSTLYKKKDKMPRENSRYNKDREDKRMSTKSQSVESINRSRDDRRDVSRSVSMPRDSGKSAGWFKKTKKVTSSQRL